jgi:hypothetical protein
MEKKKMKKLRIKALFLLLLLAAGNAELFAQTRIRFAKGRTSATVTGKLTGNGERRYILGARYGQYLSANVSSRNDCIVFGSGATSHSYITEDGDNYLYLVNTCGRLANFTLTVSINYGSD